MGKIEGFISLATIDCNMSTVIFFSFSRRQLDMNHIYFKRIHHFRRNCESKFIYQGNHPIYRMTMPMAMTIIMCVFWILNNNNTILKPMNILLCKRKKLFFFFFKIESIQIILVNVLSIVYH